MNSKIARRIRARHRADQRFRLYGILALGGAAAMLGVLLVSLMVPGVKGLFYLQASLPISPEVQQVTQELPPSLQVKRVLSAYFPDVTARRDKRALYSLLAPHAGIAAQTHDTVMHVPLSSSSALWVSDGMLPDTFKRYGLSQQQAAWLGALHEEGRLISRFDTGFFTEGDSRNPERAGIGGGLMGSLFIVLICLACALPMGVGAAMYLQEFSRPSRLRDIVEVSINNLAAIPSIIYGLLGLFVYLQLFGLPRSSALVGGLTLSLMTLPIIIISTRLALAAVPDSLRDAARGLGASPLQVVMHHVLPQALPGIITGTILGLARALGETAPLLMIGMVAFIANPPITPLDPATAMPVQIYLWASSPEQGFTQKTASGILVLIGLLLCMNLLATYIRHRSERNR